MKIAIIILFLALAILCQGCFVFPYPTPEVKGSVIDASTRQPITGVKVKIREHSKTFCKTSADGNFDLPAGHIWGFCYIMPGDYIEIAHLSFAATNYQTFPNNYVGGYGGKPIILDHPVELQKKSAF